MLKTVACLIGFIASTALGNTPSEPTCEVKNVRFAGLDWDSNGYLTEIARVIVEAGFKCPTDSIPGSTAPLLLGMERGDVDVMMEVWENNIKDAWEKGVKSGQIASLGVTYKGARQGFFVPRYLIEGDAKRGIKALAPDLKSVTDLTKYEHLFRDDEEPTKGRIYNCIYGWGCEIVNTNKMKAYGLDKEFTNFRPGTAAAISAAVASAYKRGKPFVTYYWEPTWIMGLYDLVMLKEPAYDEKTWTNLTIKDNPHPTGMAYPLVDVTAGVNTKFMKQAPKLTKFLTDFELTLGQVNEGLGYMQNKDASFRQAAVHFLKTQPAIWHPWVGKDVAEAVDKALKSGTFGNT